MRLFAKLMILILVLALAGPFFIKGPNGQPLMQVSDVKNSVLSFFGGTKQNLKDAKNDISRSLGDEQAGKTELYRWQDANGQWHYSDEKPANAAAETIEVDPNVVEMSKPKPTTTRRAESADNSAQTGQLTLPSGILTPGRVKQAVDDTKAVRDQVEQRQEQVKQQVDDM